MVRDPDTLKELQSEWAGVQRMLDRMRTLVVGTFATGTGITAPGVAKVVYNLPLLLAFDVLAQALRALRDQKDFKCKKHGLGTMVNAAKTTLPWIDWQAISDGVHERNQVAHDGTLHTPELCIGKITAVESQLIAWGIIDTASPPALNVG